MRILRGCVILFALLVLPSSGPTHAQNPAARLGQFARSASDLAEVSQSIGGALATHETATFPVELSEGMDYLVAAFCDESCSDLDLVLLNPAGAGVASDIFPNDEPMLAFRANATGLFQVQVSMVACSTSSCAFSMGVFEGILDADLDLEVIHMNDRMTQMRRELVETGYTPLLMDEVGRLKQDHELLIPMPLEAGVSYEIVGLCDEECTDLDLALYTPWSELVAADRASNAEPRLTVFTEESEHFRLSVYMAACESISCEYRISVFGSGERIGPGGLPVPGTLLLNDTIGATLDEGDRLLEDGGYADSYPVDLEPGQVLLAYLKSPAFPTRLTLETPAGRREVSESFGDDPMASHLAFVADEAGTYSIVVSSTDPGSTGAYVLHVAVSEDPTKPPFP